MTEPTAATGNPVPPRRRAPWRALLAVSLVANVVLAALWFTADATDDADTVDTRTSDPADATPTTTTPTTTPTTTVPEPAGPVRILVVGDSVASQIGWGLQEWSDAHPGEIAVFNEAHIGCGVVRYGTKRVDGLDGPVGDVCSNWNDPVALHLAAETEIVSWPSAIELFDPDIIISIVSAWDATERMVPTLGEEWLTIGDPAYDAHVLEEYLTATTVLAESGADVYWLASPQLNREVLPEGHTARIDGINALVDTAITAVRSADADASVEWLDYPGWLGPVGGARDVELRHDGVHLSEQGQAEIAPWLIEQVGLS